MDTNDAQSTLSVSLSLHRAGGAGSKTSPARFLEVHMSIKPLNMIRADLSPIFANPRGESLDNSQIEDWEGCVMFEGPHDSYFNQMEQIAQATVSVWADVTEWSCEIICTGLYRLTPREWTTKPVVRVPDCRHGDGPCTC